MRRFTPLALLITSACAMNGGPGASAVASATAQIRLADGSTVAAAQVRDGAGGLLVQVRAHGMRPGVYAVHIHPIGRCDPPDFATAGTHWNPANRQHGRDNPAGPHLGDLPNLRIGADGRGAVTFTIAGARIGDGPDPLLDADGGSILIHANPDDYQSQPSGNSGAKIACGVFEQRPA